MVYRRHNPTACTYTGHVEKRCTSAPSKAQGPHPSMQQQEGCWGQESPGKQEAVRAVCPGFVQRDRQVLLKKPYVLSTRLFGHSESSDYFRSDLVGQWLNELEKGEYFMRKVLLAVLGRTVRTGQVRDANWFCHDKVKKSKPINWRKQALNIFERGSTVVTVISAD